MLLVDVLEREEPLAVLHRAARAVVLVMGEAGIGKTSLVRAFAAATRAKVLLTACDDLRAPRTLGPLRDALGEDNDPFDALLEELGTGSIVVVEDVHWADDATLDVLAYAARRIDTVPGVLVLTFRDEEHQALQRLLGVVATAPHARIALAPLSRAAVDELAGGSAAALHRATGGNPFYVTEVLAAPPGQVPASVTDAVLARVGRLTPAARDALDQLSVVPFSINAEWLDLNALAEAEAAGVIVATPAGLRFRHEIARRAVEESLPALKRRILNANVVKALRATPNCDLARLMHHAAEAGDLDAILEFGPRAGQEAARAGSHRQALAHFETLLPHVDRLEPRIRAEVLDGYAWELYNAHRLPEAVRAGRDAAAGFAALGDDAAVGRSLVRLSRHLFLLGETEEAERCVRRAAELFEADADRADAHLHRAVILAMTGQSAAALEALETAQRLGGEEALILNYQGVARVDPEPLRQSIEIAANDEHRVRGYTNLAEVLALNCAIDELEACVSEGLVFAAEHGFGSHAYDLHTHRCVALIRRGQWDEALTGLRGLLEDVDHPGIPYVYIEPWYARLLARRGDPDAGARLAAAWEHARAQDLLIGLAYSGVAYAEWAWLNGRPEIGKSIGAELLPRLEGPFRDELARYMARAAGETPQAGASEDPYEAALMLADGGEREPLLQALTVLEGLRAEPAAKKVREQLRASGVRFRRLPKPETRANPAGLTKRQLSVLSLVAEGRTNAEIAARLDVSVRTVDHHVAAVLEKLGVHSRREAAEAARRLGVQV